MPESQQDELICEHCEAAIAPEDTFCKNCGSLFANGMVCSNHPMTEAEGVCVICSKPFCQKCGKESERFFLCDSHAVYEIQEGMARVFGCFDNVQAQYVTTCLEQSGFHPFLYSRRFNPGAGIGSTMNVGSSRNYGNYSIGELKVFVPFSEVLAAEGILKELDFIQ